MASIKVTTVERVANLELAPPFPLSYYTDAFLIAFKEMPKGIFILVTLEFTEFKARKDIHDLKDTHVALVFDLVDQKGDKFKHLGIADKGKFRPGVIVLWTPDVQLPITATMVFDVPAEAAGLKISSFEQENTQGGCKIDLIQPLPLEPTPPPTPRK